jgi:hypothetical protein
MRKTYRKWDGRRSDKSRKRTIQKLNPKGKSTADNTGTYRGSDGALAAAGGPSKLSEYGSGKGADGGTGDAGKPPCEGVVSVVSV